LIAFAMFQLEPTPTYLGLKGFVVVVVVVVVVVCKSVCDIKDKVLCFTLGVVLLGTIEINRYPKSLICLIMVLYSPVCCICNLVVSRSIPYKHQKNVLEYSTTESLRSEFRSHIFHKKLIMS